MPVGVPKVAFRIPGDEEATWVDLYNRLYRQRVLFLGQEIEYEIANQIMGLMVFLSIEDPKKTLHLLLNTPGGLVLPGMGIYDLMQTLPPEVYTYSVGMAASMGSVLLAGGEPTKRTAYPHARVMIHQPSSARFRGRIFQLLAEAGMMVDIRERITHIYAKRTGQPIWVIVEDMERDTFMSAAEAKAYGLVDLLGSENTADGV
nr:clp protease proteolytic subunit [Helanthium tenellum]UDZ59564.1 clp protease proteolytic subunit [Helanthium bolivianum]